MPPKIRAKAIESVKHILEVKKNPPALPEELTNPFSADRGVLAKPVEKVEDPVTGKMVVIDETTFDATENARRVLDAAAMELNPTGIIVLGDNPVLLFGKKRFREGDLLPVTFENKVYDLQLLSITGSSFTLGLGEQQITRPIKSYPSK